MGEGGGGGGWNKVRVETIRSFKDVWELGISSTE